MKVDRFFTIEPPGKPQTGKLLYVNLAFEHIYSKCFTIKIFSENVKDYNLRKGAATNAVQIAQVLLEKGFLG